jgi:hypothetical protein
MKLFLAAYECSGDCFGEIVTKSFRLLVYVVIVYDSLVAASIHAQMENKIVNRE